MTMAGGRARRGALELVPPSVEEPRHTIWFCGRCGERPVLAGVPAADARVCASCSMGLLLEAPADAAPAAGGAFIVLDRSLSVCAVSDGAEKLLATTETNAINRHVTELLVPAEPEGRGGWHLATAVTRAAIGVGDSPNITVRPANLFGVRMSVRIVPCGPPQAAMLVFEHAGG